MFVDAHGDFNTPETTLSGMLGGMPVAILAGMCLTRILGPHGIAGFVPANGSMSSNQSGEGEIRKSIIEADLVDCMGSADGVDKAGERDAARAEYQRFLEYWKAADPDLPELAEARARRAL